VAGDHRKIQMRSKHLAESKSRLVLQAARPGIPSRYRLHPLGHS